MRKCLFFNFKKGYIYIECETFLNAWAFPLYVCKDIYAKSDVLRIYVQVFCFFITYTHQR